ncbi:MAG: hypothetical protein M3Z33_06105 [Actinomycetota bacterium]|nr:hypothetical protein [Actinomycetota bacterium]
MPETAERPLITPSIVLVEGDACFSGVGRQCAKRDHHFAMEAGDLRGRCDATCGQARPPIDLLHPAKDVGIVKKGACVGDLAGELSRAPRRT